MVSWSCLLGLLAMVGSAYCAYKDRSILAACVFMIAFVVASACIR